MYSLIQSKVGAAPRRLSSPHSTSPAHRSAFAALRERDRAPSFADQEKVWPAAELHSGFDLESLVSPDGRIQIRFIEQAAGRVTNDLEASPEVGRIAGCDHLKLCLSQRLSLFLSATKMLVEDSHQMSRGMIFKLPKRGHNC